MVLINLTKLVKFIDIVHKTPKDVSQRRTRLLKAYDGLEADADFTVSISLSTEAAIRLKETDLDHEVYERRVSGAGGDEKSERLDFGKLTRSRRVALGIDIDYLLTGEGCRKRENITQRTERSKTAGMIYCYR